MRLGGIAQRQALADIDRDDAAADGVEEAVGDGAHLGGRAGVVAEIRPRNPRRLADEGADIQGLDGPEAWP